MNKEVYLQNLTYERVHDNIGCVIGELIFKNAMTYEEYINILDKRNLMLNDDLQQRIDKAIEYTKILREKYFRECVWGSNNDLGELLEILKGSE